MTTNLKFVGEIRLEIIADELRIACIHTIQGSEGCEASHGLGEGWMVWFLDWDLTVTSSPGGGAVTKFSAVFINIFFRNWKRFDKLGYQLSGQPCINLLHFMHAHSTVSDEIR